MDKEDFLGLSDSAVLVTGASSGIGREVAIRASRQGARVALVARDAERLESVNGELQGSGHVVFPFDLADVDSIPNLVAAVSQEMGPLDGLVHAAGVHLALPLKSMSSQDIDRLMAINVVASMMLAKGFRVKSVHREGAGIVFISSAVGLVGQSGVSAYSASKGAILTLTKSLALELARDRVRVNCVAPGVVVTEMSDRLRTAIGEVGFAEVERAHPLGIGDASDVSNAVLFLLSSSAANWITGSSLVVDGGYTAQ